MKWPKTTVKTPNGVQQAIAPLVISASRATDIPAFHSVWFMERFRAGYCVWINPFNRTMKQYVSFEQCKVIVFWSKNPAPLMPYLSELADKGIRFYFQFTLNDYVAEGLEPNVPALEDRIATFLNLSETIGKEKVIWRFDPIFLGQGLTIEHILEKIHRLGVKLSPYTEKLVFSFADIDSYKKVQSNLRHKNLALREPSQAEMVELAQGIASANRSFPCPLALASCAEKMDLSVYGIEHNKCTDDRLILRICKDDPTVHALFARPVQQASLIGDLRGTSAGPCLKDPGQRQECGCVVSKDIGSYGTCPHMCVYCYANPMEKVVTSNMARLKSDSESLL